MAFKRSARGPGQSIATVTATHIECNAPAYFSRSCGVFICSKCDEHEGLARCFCGWPQGRGLHELAEMGENVSEDY